MKTLFVIVALLVVTFVMVGALANPVAPVAADDEVAHDDGHDLETAESLLEIIEKKIAKLIKKCVKHGGCQSFYSQPYYSHSSDYGYGSGYGSYGSSHGAGYAPSHGGYYEPSYSGYAPSYGGYGGGAGYGY